MSKRYKNGITRPALRYYGGKWRLASWLLPYLVISRLELPCGEKKVRLD